MPMAPVKTGSSSKHAIYGWDKRGSFRNHAVYGHDKYPICQYMGGKMAGVRYISHECVGEDKEF